MIQQLNVVVVVVDDDDDDDEEEELALVQKGFLVEDFEEHHIAAILANWPIL